MSKDGRPHLLKIRRVRGFPPPPASYACASTVLKAGDRTEFAPFGSQASPRNRSLDSFATAPSAATGRSTRAKNATDPVPLRQESDMSKSRRPRNASTRSAGARNVDPKLSKGPRTRPPSVRSPLMLAACALLVLTVACRTETDTPIVANEPIPECDAYAEALHQCLGVEPSSFEVSKSVLAANPHRIDAAERAHASAPRAHVTQRV